MTLGVLEHGQHLLRRVIALLHRTQPAQSRGRRDTGLSAHMNSLAAGPFFVHQMYQRL